MWGQILGAGLGYLANRSSQKRQQKYSRSNMAYGNQLQQNQARWLKNVHYEGKLIVWELSGQSGGAAGGMSSSGTPGAAQHDASGPLASIANTAATNRVSEHF